MSRSVPRQVARTSRRALVAAFGILLPAASLHAQAPVITPAGDPSIRNDTIYALAVDSTAHPEEAIVLLLDDGVVRMESDGTGTQTYRMVAQILRQQAVDAWSEHTFGYDAEREEFTLNWARVVEPDGTVVSAEPIHVQELDQPIPEQAPIYTTRKIVRISLAGVAPGRIVDYSYTTRTKKPVLTGDFTTGWLITTGGTVRRSRLILDLPATMRPHIEETNLDFEPGVQHVGDRIVRTWARKDIEWIRPELFAADSNGVYQSVDVAGQIEWGDVARWYAGLTRDRYALTPELEAKLAQLTAGAASRLDTLRAVHRWVAQDIRYVSIALGIGGYQPRPPAEVFTTASGDCKDKATLFVALARRLGFEAYPMLVSARGEADRDLPSIRQFNHAIAAVRLDGDWVFVDLTADLVPLGEVPPAAEGEFGLIVRDDGTAEEVTVPFTDAGDNLSHMIIEGSVDAGGRFDGTITRRVSGMMQYELRSHFARSFAERERREMAHSMASAVFDNASGDSLEIFDGRALQAEPRIRLHATAERVLKPAAQGRIFMLPLPNYASFDLIAQLEREEERRFPFDAASVIGPREMVSEVRLRLPEGWKAELPDPVRAESAYGVYESRYEQSGRDLLVCRRIRGTREVLPPEQGKTELIDWLRRIGDDDVDFIVLQPAPETRAAQS